MNMHETHPDSEQFDKLRAGLLDDEPRLRANLEAHLGECAACQKRYTLSGYLRPGQLPVDAVGEQLDQQRHAALEAKPATRHQRLLPVAMAAALALVAVILVKPSFQENNQPDIRLAQASMDSEATPVLYEDLDFYLWMADYKEDDSAS